MEKHVEMYLPLLLEAIVKYIYAAEGQTPPFPLVSATSVRGIKEFAEQRARGG